MSWNLNGRMYHDYSDYQAARQASEARAASSRAAQAQAEADRYRQRLRQQQAEFERVQGDLAQQRRVNEQMHQDVRVLRREHHQLADAQHRFEQEANARLGEIHSDLHDMGEQLDAAEAEHRRHVEETRQAFAQARQALEAGLAEAEQRRQETERRLTAAVEAVDRKVEADRQERLRRHRGDLDQAREQIAIVEESLNEFGTALRPFNLEDDAQSIRMTLQSARSLLRQDKASASLAQAEGAFAEVRALGYKSEKRRAELAAAADAIADRIAAIRELAGNEGLDHFFKREKADLVGLLSRVADRLSRHYKQYSRLEDDLREDERVLEKLEEEARAMIAMCPALEQQIDARKKHVTSLVRKIADGYGGSADIKPELTNPDDVKSTLLVNCVFNGGEKVRIEADVDGEIRIDSAGHRTQDACERRASETVQALKAEMGVIDHHTVPGNPSELPNRTAGTPIVRSNRDFKSRLDDIRRQL
jgi:hypothetical protein